MVFYAFILGRSQWSGNTQYHSEPGSQEDLRSKWYCTLLRETWKVVPLFYFQQLFILIILLYLMRDRTIARERIDVLFKEADKIFSENPKLSNRYVNIARKIAMKFNLKIPKELKRKFCKHCYFYLKPGINCRVRTKDKKVVYYCFNCKNYMRFPLIQRKQSPICL